MHRIKIAFRVLVFLIFGLFCHYVLPQHDIVKLTSTEVIRTDFSSYNRLFYAQADSGATEQPTRDLRLINTSKQKTFLLGFIPRDSAEVMVYRNEDTGWIWPPYFKFDSSDLQAEAANLAKGDDWVVITHYGWRIRWASIYPNAIAIRTVSGPDATVIPWASIVFFLSLICAIVFVRAMWRQFRERTVDPLLDSAGHKVDEVQADMAERRGRISRWLDTWRSKK
ncbi:DUF1523 family protein [Loktanella sp. S4079]|uniref:DUF1523 family protein n=1 Tax=Loktanella sp. S4079 TaxID=579483 RepID=UPI0005FA5A29|nr:DUF1523 family protein [Loktanella sp. S4079]KJZ18868.1 hypothetical protein TW80_12370 [Loktanella sp. S4079]